jgi:catechol 2,3-dioxygenase-like lactoylglutathione lyase family enzyme
MEKNIVGGQVNGREPGSMMTGSTRRSTTRILWTLLLTGTLTLVATGTQAQSNAQHGRGPELDDRSDEHGTQGRPWGIVGTWLSTLVSTGSKGLITFSADGTVVYSVQGEVSTSPNRPPHTSLHGVWRHLGGGKFGYTVWDIWYDANTGQLIQFGKLRGEATLSDDRDEASVRARLQFLDPQGVVLVDRTGTATFTRIPFEPLE